MPGASDIELLLCTIFNVKSTLSLTKEADVQCMGKSIPDALVSYIPVGNQGFPDCFDSFYTIDKIGLKYKFKQPIVNFGRASAK